MGVNFRSFHCISAMALGVLLCFAGDVYAENLGGTITLEPVNSKDEKTGLLEKGDAGKSVDKSDSENMGKDNLNTERIMENPTEINVQAQQSIEEQSRLAIDLRLKFGSASNVQKEVDVGIYNDLKIGFILSAGIFSRTHSGGYLTRSNNTIDYDASGTSLGLGIGIKANEHLHFEGKVERGTGSGSPTSPLPNFPFGGTPVLEGGGYKSNSIIIGAYYAVSKPGFQIGLEFGTQSYRCDFRYSYRMTSYNETVEGHSSTANLVLGVSF